MHIHSFTRSLPAVLALWLAGCGGLAGAADPTANPAAQAALPAAATSAPPSAAALFAPITALIGDAECDHQGQCHALGYGAKACGGPEGHLAWSDKKTDFNALNDAVQAQARAQSRENKADGLASNCMVTPMPPAVCRPRAGDGKKVCQLGQGGAASLD